MLIRVFQILAVVLIGLAAYFFSRGDMDAAFVSGVLAICAFFLNMRFQIKQRIDARHPAEQEEQDALPDEDASV